MKRRSRVWVCCCKEAVLAPAAIVEDEFLVLCFSLSVLQRFEIIPSLFFFCSLYLDLDFVLPF